jgi:hypothetical protein
MAGIVGMFGGTAAEMRNVAQAGTIVDSLGSAKTGLASAAAEAAIPPSRWAPVGTTGETPKRGTAAKAAPVDSTVGPPIPKGMSRNEMVQEPAAKARLAPTGIDVNAKQPSADWVDRGPKGQAPKESFSHTVDKKGTAHVVHDIAGGEWAQHKALDEHARTPVEQRIRGEVRRAYNKFDRDLTAGVSRRKVTLTDGTQLTVRLSRPDGLVMYVEVPGFKRIGASAQQHLQQRAEGQLMSELRKEGGNVEARTIHGVPVRVVVIGGP